jgi:hypothetical protein
VFFLDLVAMVANVIGLEAGQRAARDRTLAQDVDHHPDLRAWLAPLREIGVAEELPMNIVPYLVAGLLFDLWRSCWCCGFARIE